MREATPPLCPACRGRGHLPDESGPLDCCACHGIGREAARSYIRPYIHPTTKPYIRPRRRPYMPRPECVICAAYKVKSPGTIEIPHDPIRDGAHVRRVYACQDCVDEGATPLDTTGTDATLTSYEDAYIDMVSRTEDTHEDR